MLVAMDTPMSPQPAHDHPTPPPAVLDTDDEALAREQVIDCALAWAARPDARNTRDLHAALAVLRRCDGSLNDDPPTPTGDEPLSSYTRQVLDDYYWGR